MNLGDEMQSYAVLAHLNRVHSLLNRDQLAEVRSDVDTACVFNSWFLIGDDLRRPAKSVKPIWHGFAGWKETIYGDWMPYLKEQSQIQGSIGCRDFYTTGLLESAGIDAHCSGCLTLFLGKSLPRRSGPRKGILFFDVPDAAEQYIPADIVRRAVRLSTFVPPGIIRNPLERWAAVARIADLVSSAELVVTRRLHVALPAAGFGTPVVAVPDPSISFARRRFSGFDRLVPTVYLDEIASGSKKIDWRDPEPVRIPQELMQAYSRLCQNLRVPNRANDAELSESALDDISRSTQSLVNAPEIAHRGRLRLRLRERVFELPVLLWTDKFIEVGLRGFPGLSKFEFVVELCRSDSDSWIACGALRDLTVGAVYDRAVFP